MHRRGLERARYEVHLFDPSGELVEKTEHATPTEPAERFLAIGKQHERGELDKILDVFGEVSVSVLRFNDDGSEALGSMDDVLREVERLGGPLVETPPEPTFGRGLGASE